MKVFGIRYIEEWLQQQKQQQEKMHKMRVFEKVQSGNCFRMVLWCVFPQNQLKIWNLTLVATEIQRKKHTHTEETKIC